MLIGIQTEATALRKSTLNTFFDKNILCVTFRPYKYSHNSRKKGFGKGEVTSAKQIFTFKNL